MGQTLRSPRPKVTSCAPNTCAALGLWDRALARLGEAAHRGPLGAAAAAEEARPPDVVHCVCVCMYVYIYIYICVHTYIYIYIYI